MSQDNFLKSGLAAIILLASIAIHSPAQARTIDSCQGSDRVILTIKYRYVGYRLFPYYAMEIMRDHPLCRAEP